MLLIAQPKSASTSLKYSIVENAFINNTLKDRKEYYNINCDEFLEMQKIFTTIYDLDSKQLYDMLINRNFIYKKHVLPIKRHLNIIDKLKIPFVLLLRNVDESIDSLKRLKNRHNKIYNWDYDLDKIHDEFKIFNQKWYSFSKDKDYIKVIYFKDLIEGYQNTMDDIFEHYKLRKRINYIELQNKGRTENK
jgi:hypothetical protein